MHREVNHYLNSLKGTVGLVKLPLVSSHYAFLPLSSYFVAALISVYFCFLFLLFVLLFVLIFLTVAEAQPTALQGMKSLNETVGDKDLGSSHAVSNYLWSLKEKHEPCDPGGASLLCNLSWSIWMIYLRHWGRRRCDPFLIAYPTWVPTSFWGFSWVKETLRSPGLTKYMSSPETFIMLSYLIVTFPPSVHQNRKVSAFAWCALGIAI